MPAQGINLLFLKPMSLKNKLSFILATFCLILALSLSPAQAQEDNADCQIIYGGQVCGISEPPVVDTAGQSQILYTLSAALYSTGLVSFILAKNSSHLIPKLS